MAKLAKFGGQEIDVEVGPNDTVGDLIQRAPASFHASGFSVQRAGEPVSLDARANAEDVIVFMPQVRGGHR